MKIIKKRFHSKFNKNRRKNPLYPFGRCERVFCCRKKQAGSKSGLEGDFPKAVVRIGVVMACLAGLQAWVNPTNKTRSPRAR